MIARYRPGAKTVLELACGTGAVLAGLAKEYEVAGLDSSSKMLSVARRKLPGARFFRADMRTFDLGEKFDAILCVFDSINHVLEFPGWQRVFRRAAAHLSEGGLFIFDINTERKLQRLVEAPATAEEFGQNLMVVDVRDAGGRVVNWNVKIFERQKGTAYKLFEENVKERSFPAGEIRAALLEQFDSVRVLDPKRRMPSDKSERLYFVCMSRRPA